MRGLFPKSSFSWGNKPLSANFWRVVLHGESNYSIIQREKEFHASNAFSSNLDTINPKVFAKHGWNIVPNIMLTLAWNNGIVFEKLKPEIGVWIWKTLFGHSISGWWRFHARHVNIFYDDLHFDALVIGLC